MPTWALQQIPGMGALRCPQVNSRPAPPNPRPDMRMEVPGTVSGYLPTCTPLPYPSSAKHCPWDDRSNSHGSQAPSAHLRAFLPFPGDRTFTIVALPVAVLLGWLLQKSLLPLPTTRHATQAGLVGICERGGGFGSRCRNQIGQKPSTNQARAEHELALATLPQERPPSGQPPQERKR